MTRHRQGSGAAKEFLTCHEACLYTGGYWSADTVRRDFNEGRLPGIRDGLVKTEGRNREAYCADDVSKDTDFSQRWRITLR